MEDFFEPCCAVIRVATLYERIADRVYLSISDVRVECKRCCCFGKFIRCPSVSTARRMVSYQLARFEELVNHWEQHGANITHSTFLTTTEQVPASAIALEILQRYVDECNTARSGHICRDLTDLI